MHKVNYDGETEERNVTALMLKCGVDGVTSRSTRLNMPMIVFQLLDADKNSHASLRCPK